MATETERQVFLVQTREDYERPTIIESYLNRGEAEARVDQLNAYAARAPKCPAVDDSGEKWDKFWAAEKIWKDNHPLGSDHPGYLNQMYEVEPVPLRGS